MNPVLPDSRFGMTATNYNVSDIPATLPDRESFAVANKFNEVRYYKLTHKQRVFVDAYLGNNFDATAAAVQAGFTEEEAPRVGRRMLMKKAIKEAIHWALQYFTERNKLKLEHLTDELKIIALSNMGDFFKNDGNGDPYIQMPEDGDPRMRAVSEITVDSYFEGKGDSRREVKRIKFKLHDKLSAIEKLLKILQPKLDADDEAKAASATNVNVTTVNIVAVPQGQFMPAPQPPKQLTIEYADTDLSPLPDATTT